MQAFLFEVVYFFMSLKLIVNFIKPSFPSLIITLKFIFESSSFKFPESRIKNSIICKPGFSGLENKPVTSEMIQNS